MCIRDRGRPVLVGTTSVEISELLSRMLKLRNIKHNVLNAKQHQLEAQVVAEAGRSGQVTIATNMASWASSMTSTSQFSSVRWRSLSYSPPKYFEPFMSCKLTNSMRLYLSLIHISILPF